MSFGPRADAPTFTVGDDVRIGGGQRGKTIRFGKVLHFVVELSEPVPQPVPSDWIFQGMGRAVVLKLPSVIWGGAEVTLPSPS